MTEVASFCNVKSHAGKQTEYGLMWRLKKEQQLKTSSAIFRKLIMFVHIAISTVWHQLQAGQHIFCYGSCMTAYKSVFMSDVTRSCGRCSNRKHTEPAQNWFRLTLLSRRCPWRMLSHDFSTSQVSSFRNSIKPIWTLVVSTHSVPSLHLSGNCRL